MDTSGQVMPASKPSGDLSASSRELGAEDEKVHLASGALDRTDWLIMAVLVALLLFYFRSLLWTDTFIYGGLDIRRSIYLFRKVSYELLREGHMPLWMPYIYCGMPLLGSFLTTPFYPLDLIFAFTNIPLNMAFNWDLLIHLVAAQTFSYLFFRRLLKNRMGAIFCSMWFWNIFFLNSITIGDAPNIRAMLLAPMVFYFLEAAASRGGRTRDFLLLSCALSLQVLSGGVQFAFYTLAAATGYMGFMLLFHPFPVKLRMRLFVSFALAVSIALALAGIQLLPQWEYSRLSLRAMRHDWFRVWAVQPHQLLNYLFLSTERLGYFGMVPIVLAPFSLISWKDKRKYFFLLLALISILYALGGSNPISAFLANFPVLRDFRGPFRATIFFDLSVYALAGGAIASAWEADVHHEKKWKQIVFGILIPLMIIGFVFSAGAAKQLLQVSSIELYFSALMAALSVPAIYLLLFSHRQRQVSAIFLVSLLAFDLGFHYGRFYSPAHALELFSEDNTARFLEQSKDSRVLVLNTAESNYFGLFGIKSANGHHPFPLVRHVQFLTLLENKSHEKLASLAGIKFIVDFNPTKKNLPAHPPITNKYEVAVRRMPREPLAPAFLVNSFKRADDPADALSSIQAGFDPAVTVILEQAPGHLELPPAPDPGGRAAVLSNTANQVVIETESDHNAILVLTDAYYPGWRAKIDGNDVEALRADYLFRAVPVPAGKHLVEFEFKPWSAFWGALISCFGAAALLGWAVVSVIKGKTATQTPDLPVRQ